MSISIVGTSATPALQELIERHLAPFSRVQTAVFEVQERPQNAAGLEVVWLARIEICRQPLIEISQAGPSRKETLSALLMRVARRIRRDSDVRQITLS